MNSAEAKNISIIDLLSHLGYEPIKIENSDYWYSSPLHEDKTSSFKVNTIKNIWIDYGIPSPEEKKTFLGGRTLDLVMNIYNLQVSEALKRLSSIFNYSDTEVSSSFFHQQKINQIQDFAKSHFELKRVKDLEYKVLLNYLTGRKINLKVAKKYLKEIYYSRKGKNYFSLAFKNDSEGYETRNAYFKGCIGSKDITTIKGTENNKLSIFEGFMDFLSALTYFKIDEFKSDVIILNSVSNKAKIEELLYSDIYSNIYLFLDNDKAGHEARQYFFNINKNCVDCSNIYAENKDFNDFLN